MERTLNEVTIEVIQKCNSSCIFCSSNSNSLVNSEIPLSKVIEIIDFSISHGAKSINISGGEPLLYNNLLDVMNYCSEKNIGITIYSSGNVDISCFNRLLKSSFDKNKTKFIFNYPSLENDVYQELINSTNYSISTLNDYIKMMIENNIFVEVHIVPNKLNLNSLYKSAKHLKQIGVNNVSFLRLVLQGRAEINKEKLFVQSEDVSGVIKEIKKELCDDNFHIRGGVPFSNLLVNKCECFAGISKLIFRYDGVVFPCEAFKEAPSNESYKLGSIYYNSLEEIWNNHPVHNKLKLLKQRAIDISEPCPAQILY